MRRLHLALAFVVVVLTASAANAQVSLNSVRVVAKNAEALAKFYSTEFFVVDPEGDRIELIQPAQR